ncbi:MAG TPA: DUF2971 domain-containing protein [Xanthobacteraceae bacterium]|nr:DUF2971 domain-containing protein [Xanthobacteraceae bacterium]
MAAEIETYVIPRYLYRYRSLKEFDREMQSIETDYLYCANYRAMNDPMEGHYSTSKLLQKSADAGEVRDAIFSEKMAIGICSFSEVFDNELMWAHYANQFRGICVAYDFFNLRKYLPFGITFSRVYYNEEVPKVGHSKRRNSDRIAKMILSYKKHQWPYEREWRMFANIGEVYYQSQKCVARVYIGARIERTRLNQITSRLSALKIPYRIQKLAGYHMSFHRAANAKVP